MQTWKSRQFAPNRQGCLSVNYGNNLALMCWFEACERVRSPGDFSQNLGRPGITSGAVNIKFFSQPVRAK